MTTYISPSLPGMIRNLWKSDPSERSVRTALNLAGDLIQELIDLRDQPAADHQELPNADGPTDAEVRAAAEESTTDLGSIRDWYAGAVDEYWCDTGMLRDEAEAAFDRAIAAHDRALREQIAQKIEVEMRRHDNAQIGFSAVGDAYAHAARIARGEGSE